MRSAVSPSCRIHPRGPWRRVGGVRFRDLLRRRPFARCCGRTPGRDVSTAAGSVREMLSPVRARIGVIHSPIHAHRYPRGVVAAAPAPLPPGASPAAVTLHTAAQSGPLRLVRECALTVPIWAPISRVRTRICRVNLCARVFVWAPHAANTKRYASRDRLQVLAWPGAGDVDLAAFACDAAGGLLAAACVPPPPLPPLSLFLSLSVPLPLSCLPLPRTAAGAPHVRAGRYPAVAAALEGAIAVGPGLLGE